MTRRDYYDILGVGRAASDQEIKSAYRKLALKFHPDRNQGDSTAEERFKEAAEAYAVLGDVEKRSRYDRFGHAGVSGPAGGGPGFNPDIFADFSDILGDFFGFGGGAQRGGPVRGADLRFDLEITFEESFAGAETTIQIPREEACQTCHGSGAAPGTSRETCPQCGGRGNCGTSRDSWSSRARAASAAEPARSFRKPCAACRGTGRDVRDRRVTVRIPAGIADGQRLRLSGEGEHGTGGGPPGDLYVVVHVRPHKQFHRRDDDLFMDVPVPFPMAALGGSFQIDGPGGEITVHVPAGSSDGNLVSFRGKGMPSVTGHGRGALHVRITVDVPKKLTKEQRKLVDQLGRTFASDKLSARSTDDAHDRPFFEKVKDLFG